jgi:carbon monoxide dehydrogenase subunit G
LQKSIQGCESLTRTGPNEFQMVMLAAIGPVRAHFKAKLTMSEVQPPTSYVLTFAGNGGAAGFGNGSAHVRLEPEPGGTRMSYEASAQVGGKMAQVGSRLVQSVAEKLSEQFFTSFVAQVEANSQAAASPRTPQHDAAAAPTADAKPITRAGGAASWYRQPQVWAAVAAASAVALVWAARA